MANKLPKKITLDVGDIFFAAANNHLRLGLPPYHERPYDHEFPYYGEADVEKTAYVCRAITDTLRAIALKHKLSDDHYSALLVSDKLIKNRLEEGGMDSFGFNVFNQVEVEHRQEARWFFLMLLAEKHKGETITV